MLRRMDDVRFFSWCGSSVYGFWMSVLSLSTYGLFCSCYAFLVVWLFRVFASSITKPWRKLQIWIYCYFAAKLEEALYGFWQNFWLFFFPLCAFLLPFSPI